MCVCVGRACVYICRQCCQPSYTCAMLPQGLVPAGIRLIPHTVLTFMFLEQLKSHFGIRIISWLAPPPPPLSPVLLLSLPSLHPPTHLLHCLNPWGYSRVNCCVAGSRCLVPWWPVTWTVWSNGNQAGFFPLLSPGSTSVTSAFNTRIMMDMSSIASFTKCHDSTLDQSRLTCLLVKSSSIYSMYIELC